MQSRHVELALYADDTAIIATSRKPVLLVSYLEANLSGLERWLREWRIAINVSQEQRNALRECQVASLQASTGAVSSAHLRMLRYAARASSDCVCARCDFRVELILALIHCSVSQSVCGATMEWTQENALGFIELYEEMSVLWDPNHPKYYNKLHKHLLTRSSKQGGDHSAQPVRRNSRCYVATDCSRPYAA